MKNLAQGHINQCLQNEKKVGKEFTELGFLLFIHLQIVVELEYHIQNHLSFISYQLMNCEEVFLKFKILAPCLLSDF